MSINYKVNRDQTKGIENLFLLLYTSYETIYFRKIKCNGMIYVL
jgi:hypothetical protein